MQFRWAIGIALWTMLSGPIFAPPPSGGRPAQRQATAKQSKPFPLHGAAAVLPVGRR